MAIFQSLANTLKLLAVGDRYEESIARDRAQDARYR